MCYYEIVPLDGAFNSLVRLRISKGNHSLRINAVSTECSQLLTYVSTNESPRKTLDTIIGTKSQCTRMFFE